MTKFNTDSLDFVDDEELRTGSSDDFATRFSSANDRLELADLTNGTVGYVPRGTGTDLVDGKFAQTVSEGKALADDGNVYDSIQDAVDAASSWVKIGPGTFNESININNAGLTVKGSGERTIIDGENNVVNISSNDVVVAGFTVYGQSSSFSRGVTSSGVRVHIHNIRIAEAENEAINVSGSDNTVSNCYIEDAGNRMLRVNDAPRVIITGCTLEDTQNRVSGAMLALEELSDDGVVAHNIIKNTDEAGIRAETNDSMFYGNIIYKSDSGIYISGTDNIVVNNRISAGTPIGNNGTGGVVQDNLTT